MNARLIAIRSAVAASVAAATLALPMPVTSVAHESSQAVAHLRTQLRYSFDRGESLRPGTIVRDVSGHHHAGRVQVADGGHLRVVQGVARRGAGYPRRCLNCGKAIVEARDRAGLDPRRHIFLFGLAMKVTRFQGRGDSNLLQKGYYDQPGGQYKLQLNNGVPSCVVFGNRGRLIVEGQRSVADGTWHRLDCRRSPGVVTLRVDHRVVAQVTGRTGLIRNAAPVRVGGRNLGNANDQYHGALDNVFLRIRR